MELFETLANGLSIIDYCRQELRLRGWEGPGYGSENRFRNHLFIYLFIKFVYEFYLLLNLRQIIYEFSLKYFKSYFVTAKFVWVGLD